MKVRVHEEQDDIFGRKGASSDQLMVADAWRRRAEGRKKEQREEEEGPVSLGTAM